MDGIDNTNQATRAKILWRFILIGVTLLWVAAGCADQPQHQTSPDPTRTPEPSTSPTPYPTETLSHGAISPRSWYTNANYDWPHDGYPFESEHFFVYSDLESMSTKQRFAQEAETVLARILPLFVIPDGDPNVRIVYPKFEMFVSSFRYGEVLWQGTSHYGGFLLVFDGAYYQFSRLRYPDYFPFTYLITHELTHVICYRIIRFSHLEIDKLPQAWFNEGLATYMGGPPLPIRTLQLYEIAMREVSHFPENGNPIHIRYPIVVPYDYPYILYELSVYYLVETYGLENVIGILYDMRDHLTFEEAFEKRTGMTVDEYQQNFDSLMRNFFGGSDPP